MTEIFWYQAAALFWVSVCFFRVGAMTKRIRMGWKTWSEIGQAGLVVVLLFTLLTGAQGCRSVGGTTASTCLSCDE